MLILGGLPAMSGSCGHEGGLPPTHVLLWPAEALEAAFGYGSGRPLKIRWATLCSCGGLLDSEPAGFIAFIPVK